MPEYLCALDAGTTGVKAGLFTPDGDTLAMSYQEYRVSYPGPQWVEQSVQEMWQAQCQVTREVISRADLNPADIATVAVSSQRATFVPVDRDEQPLTAFIGWQDRRSLAQIELMKSRIDPKRYYQITGLPLEPTAAVSKILWIKQNLPEVFERTAYFASTQNVHLRQLGVEFSACDLPDAAYLGLLDLDRLTWSQELLAAFEIPTDKMPPLVPSGIPVGVVSQAAADSCGLAQGTPIVSAGGDLQCAGVGLGITEPGRASVGIGTGGGVLTYVDQPARHPEQALNCLPHAVAGAWEVEGICLASGAAYKWFRDNLESASKESAQKMGVDAYELINDLAAQVPPGSHGTLVMPSLIGSGAPNWYPQARGVLLGLTLSTDRMTLARAFLEGICYEIRWMLEAVETLGIHLGEIRIWGGAARSKLWNQIAADIYGLPASRMRVDDAGLVGAAICAGVGIGIYRDARQGAQAMVHPAERYEPNPALRNLYDEMFDLYKTTYNLLREGGVFERLSLLGAQ